MHRTETFALFLNDCRKTTSNGCSWTDPRLISNTLSVFVLDCRFQKLVKEKKQVRKGG